MYLLDNTLRHYPWGSTTAIAELLGRTPSGGPEAELWIGAHPDSPSRALLRDGGEEALDSLIAVDPVRALGDSAAEQYDGRLPFLMKVLAAAAPLSLQVHPSLAQAREGFAAENAAGLPQDAPERNYRDGNHKPEMIFALTPFEALCGFRALHDAAGLFAELAERVAAQGIDVPQMISGLADGLRDTADESEALRGAFTLLLTGGEETTRAVELAAAAIPDPGTENARPAGSALAVVARLARDYPGDPGVLISLLLNHVVLEPGEAVYLPAGNIHAYLRGTGIEVMASSDNVLRGGLTTKHVDVPELLRTVEFHAIDRPAVEPEFTQLDQELYRPPFGEFQLQRIELHPAIPPAESMSAPGVPLVQNGPVLVLAVSGALILDSLRGDLLLKQGESAFVPANEAPVIAKPAVPVPGARGTGAAPSSSALAFAVTVGEGRPPLS
jgi:mannose-6-phosphate isomerase